MKSSSTIDLMKTSNGYSVIQNEVLINKVNSNSTVSLNNSTNSLGKYNKQKPSSAISKKFVPQQNFTIYPYIYDKQDENHKYIVIPSRTQWFNLNNVHDIQKKALPQWFKQKKGVSATINHMKFQKNEQLYKKYRNHIIQLGKNQYVTAMMARKGLAGDACSIIRIHNHLQKWGLINYVHTKPVKQKQNQGIQLQSFQDQLNNTIIKRKDGFDRDKSCITKVYDKDDLQLLKKITKRFRPACNSCQGICGVVWYEYNQQLKLKQFTLNPQTNIHTVKSGQKYEYNLKVCFACYNQKNFPVVLSFDDFTKKSILNSISSIDFDKKYKKKSAQFIKISETIQKNKFNINKSAQILKMSQNQLLDNLIQMPVQNLQKISRIQPETDDQGQRYDDNHINLKNQKRSLIKSQKSFDNIEQDQEEIKILESNLLNLDIEQKKAYQKFLQSWLMKIYAKIQLLQEWDKTIQWRVQSNQSVKKYNLAQRIKNSFKQ